LEKGNDSIISIKNLDVYFSSKQILKSISCEIPEKKITVIIGQSGCGKSTFLKSINRIVEEEGGRLSGGLCVSRKNVLEMQKEALRKQVGLVFQTPVIFPFSVKKNMLYPLNYHYNLTSAEKTEKIIHYLKLVGLYEEVLADINMSATKLSGGQKQRLSIARCLCTEPDILMLDEPCSALDIGNTILIESLLHSLKESFTIVVVTHNLAQAKRIADYVLFMDNGELIEANDNSIFSAPQNKLTSDYFKYINEM